MQKWWLSILLLIIQLSVVFLESGKAIFIGSASYPSFFAKPLNDFLNCSTSTNFSLQSMCSFNEKNLAQWKMYILSFNKNISMLFKLEANVIMFMECLNWFETHYGGDEEDGCKTPGFDLIIELNEQFRSDKKDLQSKS